MLQVTTNSQQQIIPHSLSKSHSSGNVSSTTTTSSARRKKYFKFTSCMSTPGSSCDGPCGDSLPPAPPRAPGTPSPKKGRFRKLGRAAGASTSNLAVDAASTPAANCGFDRDRKCATLPVNSVLNINDFKNTSTPKSEAGKMHLL